MVCKNKTDSRSSLRLDGTLSNLLAIKLQYPDAITPCFEWNPDKALLSNSKKATTTYNQEHNTWHISQWMHLMPFVMLMLCFFFLYFWGNIINVSKIRSPGFKYQSPGYFRKSPDIQATKVGRSGNTTLTWVVLTSLTSCCPTTDLATALWNGGDEHSSTLLTMLSWMHIHFVQTFCAAWSQLRSQIFSNWACQTTPWRYWWSHSSSKPPPQCSAPNSPPHRTAFPKVGGLHNLCVLYVLIRRVEGRRPQPTSVRTVNYLCVLNYITLK